MKKETTTNLNMNIKLLGDKENGFTLTITDLDDNAIVGKVTYKSEEMAVKWYNQFVKDSTENNITK